MEIFGYTFKDEALLKEALTTPAFRMDRPNATDNQRLEFLGDAVLGLLAAERLYAAFPGEAEGTLTVRRTHMVSATALCAAADRLGLVLRLKRNRRASALSPHAKTIADAVEAIIGAAYLDGGFAAARKVFAALELSPDVETDPWDGNPKGELQIRAQALRPARRPVYELLKAVGAAHAPTFTVRVAVEGVGSAEATAGSHKEAEARAAAALLRDKTVRWNPVRAAVAAFLLAVCAGGAWAEKPPYDRYQSIVDRQMFGALPVGFDPTKLPSEVTKSSQKELTKEQEQLKSAIRFSVINQTPDGQVAVGFTDNTDSKNPCHYYLKVGETRGGWLVKEADPETATMTIAKGEIEVTLTIGGDSAKDAGATAKAGAAKASDGIALQSASGRARSPLLRTLGGRRRERAAEAREREEERQAREAEREEQRNQLLAIQSELKAMREKKQAAAAQEATQEAEKETSEHANDDAE